MTTDTEATLAAPVKFRTEEATKARKPKAAKNAEVNA